MHRRFWFWINKRSWIDFWKIKVVGCLFHFRQLLFKRARTDGLFKKTSAERTIKIIDSLSAMCWDIGNLETHLKEIKKKEIWWKSLWKLLFLLWENWTKILKKCYIDYSNINQLFRANSITEPYWTVLKDQYGDHHDLTSLNNLLKEEEAHFKIKIQKYEDNERKKNWVKISERNTFLKNGNNLQILQRY